MVRWQLQAHGGGRDGEGQLMRPLGRYPRGDFVTLTSGVEHYRCETGQRRPVPTNPSTANRTRAGERPAAANAAETASSIALKARVTPTACMFDGPASPRPMTSVGVARSATVVLPPPSMPMTRSPATPLSAG